MDNIFLFPLLAGLVWGIATVADKYSATSKINPIHVAYWFWIIGLITGALGIYIMKVPLVLSPNIFIRPIIPAIITIIYSSSYYLVAKKIPLSQLTLLTKSSILIYALGGIIIFNETLTDSQTAGSILIISGIFLLNLKKKIGDINKWSLFAIIVGILSGSLVLVNKSFSYNLNPNLYQFTIASYIVILLTPFIFADIKKNKSKIFSKIEPLPIFISGFFSYIGEYLIYLSYSIGAYVSITNLLPQIRTPIAVIYGIFIFKERSGLLKKIICTVLIVGGVILLKM